MGLSPLIVDRTVKPPVVRMITAQEIAAIEALAVKGGDADTARSVQSEPISGSDTKKPAGRSRKTVRQAQSVPEPGKPKTDRKAYLAQKARERRSRQRAAKESPPQDEK